MRSMVAQSRRSCSLLRLVRRVENSAMGDIKVNSTGRGLKLGALGRRRAVADRVKVARYVRRFGKSESWSVL